MEKRDLTQWYYKITDYAQELLENSDLPVSQIAFQCGFGDANNFIRAFRESFGLSPSQFRQREGRRP